jgi:CheY-like chemotaxis protein
VLISAFISGDQLKIAVSDTGIGIDAEKLPHIFDEFRQADETTSRKFGGTGLGLAIAQKYAFILNGNVEVQSSLGKGSVFTFSLPLDNAESSLNPPILRRPSRIANLELPLAEINYPEMTIMVVEDSEPQIIQLQDILQHQGYKTIVAKNGREALELIALQPPDGIILDLMMPEVDGFTVLRELKSSERSASIPVLILTAKHVTQAEFSFLTGNHIYQLIQKGDVNKSDLLREIKIMLLSAHVQQDSACFVNSSPLPIASSTSAVAKKTKGKIISPLDGTLLSILIVEDNEDNMLTIKALLDDKYQIIEAVDGESGVQKAKEYVPDLILMDIALPGMNGLQAMDAIRNTPGLGHIPIVAVTASVMKGNREEILAYGFDGFIAKPINHNFFYATIEGILYGAD